MILDRPEILAEDLERRTGWAVKPEGACKGDLCVPLGEVGGEGGFDLRAVAERLGMPLVRDERHGIWALGPDSVGGRALAGAEAPELELPDWRGEPFRLSSLRGLKVLLVCWASW